MILDESYVKLKNDVIKAERRLLKELGFCVHVQHPHKVNIWATLPMVIRHFLPLISLL